MKVAELNSEIVGVIQGSIKVVTLHRNPSKDWAKVGYILGLRVSPPHRQKGIGSTLVRHLEAWFVANQADYAYMATDKDNQPSVNLFTTKLGFVKFMTPAILVHPVNNSSSFRLPPTVEISKLKIEQAEFLYKKFMGSTEFFPHDIDKVLGNKLSLGTWVAYPRGESWPGGFGLEGQAIPRSWAMLSVWNSGQIFKLRVGKTASSCCFYRMWSRLIGGFFPCVNMSGLPDFSEPFGFYFMYGVHREGPSSEKLVRTLCRFVHNMAKQVPDCKFLVTEVVGGDGLKLQIPHWKLLSCPEDLWCIKALRNESRKDLREMTKNSAPPRALFVDPREV
ncbi:hypothetical protein U1Q18_033516 [Sarracenia purpurea var. burkii]